MSKIVDSLGNEIREGDTMAWLMPNGNKLLVHVDSVTPAGMLQTTEGKSSGKMKLIIDLQWPYEKQEAGKARVFSDMIVTRDPRSEQLIERLVANA